MAHDDHGHGHVHGEDDGQVHVHISSIPFYLAIFSALIALTVLTVGVSYIHLGKANLLVAIIIASLKASLVVLFFMHLRHDHKFNSVVFISSLLFIGVFFAYTLNDTDRRGEIDESGNMVRQSSGEVAPGTAEGTISPERSRILEYKPATAASSAPTTDHLAPAKNEHGGAHH